jgi:hypothetical protein
LKPPGFRYMCSRLICSGDKIQKNYWRINACDCCRWFPREAGTYINVPVLGPLSKLGLIVAPFCITFSVLWGVFRQASFAWVGQDILACIFTTIPLPHDEIDFCPLHAFSCVPYALLKGTCFEWSYLNTVILTVPELCWTVGPL